MTTEQIAILGTGPTGLEAALAAVDAGLPFTLYETAPHTAGSVRRWGHVTLFTPWSMNVSPRMRRHLETADINVPDGGDCPTGHELVDRLLDPVAQLPAVAPNVRVGTRALSVSRKGLLKHEEIGTGERAAHPFRLVLQGPDGGEYTEEASVVLDCTGTYEVANALGEGGVCAPGERAADARILRHIPDLREHPEEWVGKTIVLVGAGHSAQTAACDLAALAEANPGTRIVWALRRGDQTWSIDADDPLPERSGLTRRAAEIASGANSAVEVLTGVTVDAVRGSGETVDITLLRADGATFTRRADLVVSLTGYVGDAGLYRQLQVHECYATSAPMKLAAALLAEGSSDCLAQDSHGAETLANPEPGFFILGIKSYGRSSGFLMQVGWSQVDEVFSLLTSQSAGV